MLKWLKKNFHFWQYLTNFWSFVFFTAVIFDFLTNNGLHDILDTLAFIYIGILAVYSGHKEFERWHHQHESQHPGEMFVIFWTAMIIVLVLLDAILKKPYHLPSSVISAYIAVLSILAITERSKKMYHHKRRK